MKKRIFSLILAVALCMSCLPTAAFAAEGEGVQDSGDPTIGYSVIVTAATSDGATSEYGSVSGNGGSYSAGDSVTLTATPADGKCFYRWNVTKGGVSEPSDGERTFSFSMPASDVEITAQFGEHVQLSQDLENGNHKSYCMYCGEVFIESEQHILGEYHDEENGHYANCSKDCGYQTELESHDFDDNFDTTCNTCNYTRTIPLTISVSHAYLIGGGTITITTSKPADQVTADFEDGLEDGLIKITTNNKINWTATIPDHILGRTYFIATDENGSVESAEVNFSPTFWINPTSETLTGGGTVTLVTAVPVSSVTCDAGGINVQGSGDEWTATLPNRTATYTFTATLDNYTASCTVSVTYSATGSSGSSDDSDDDDDYTPSDDAGNESGNNTQPQPETPPADESGYVRQQQDPLDTVYTVPVTGEQTVQVTADVTEDEDGRVQVSILPLTPEQLAVLGDAPTVIIDLTGVEDTGSIEAAIPGKAVQDISEGTQGDVQLKTPIADVIIGHDAIAENAGELVMEARRTEDGISTKVSIGGVSVIDTGVKLPAGVTLPEDGKLVVGTLQPGADALNFLPLTETTEPSTRMAMVPEDIIVSMEAAVIGPDGGSYTQHEKLLINGKEYYVSDSGDGESLSLYDKEGNIYSYDGEKDPQAIGQDAGTEYPENEFISINGAVYQIHSVQRDTDGNGTLILYLDGKPAGMCQFDQYEEMNSINIYNEDYAPDKVRERQQNGNQLGTVTTGETPIDGLETGKTYNVSVIGSQDISVPGYDEAVLNSIKAETEAEKAAKEEVERLKADMEAKKAAVDQLDATDPNHMEAWAAWDEAETAYKEALAELAALANLQSATVTQTFDIPNELVGRTDVTFAAVHNTNPFPVPGSSIRDDIANFIEEWHKQWEETYSPEIGTVEVSEDGQTLTATYTVSSFSPFTIYAFTEADEPEVKVITTAGGAQPPAEETAPTDTAQPQSNAALPVAAGVVALAAVGGGWFVWKKRREKTAE